MTETETDAEFLKRIANDSHFQYYFIEPDRHRLLRLAERGARVPDEPTEAMLEAAEQVYTSGYTGTPTAGPERVYRAMLTTALTKDTDK